MLEVEGGRVTDPKTLSVEDMADACKQRGRLIVQFSRPEIYDRDKLEVLNEACRLEPDRLQIRFFGHYGAVFDASVLRHLPEARDVSIDYLKEIEHEEEIGRLPNLKRLGFGVFELNRSDLLGTFHVERLERFALFENRKRNTDLSPLARCRLLDDLFIHGHSKSIEAIWGLPRLRKLTLAAYAKTHGLGFIASIPCLKELTLLLGGRSDIEDLSSTTIETLQVLRVRGLATLGDLLRLPMLSGLRVEDQLHLLQLDIGGVRLERLSLLNCKKLAELLGVDTQDRLREVRISDVALDLNVLRDREWPPTLRAMSLLSSNRKWNADTRLRLMDRGLREARHWI